MAAPGLLKRLESRAATAEQTIDFLKKEVADLRRVQQGGNKNDEVSRLRKENEDLKREIEEWKKKLIQLEVAQNIQQISIPDKKQGSENSSNISTPQITSIEVAKSVLTENTIDSQSKNTINIQKDDTQDKKSKAAPGKKEEKVKKVKGGDGGGASEEPPVDVRRLDFRVGRIVSVKKHPDADSLYVEEIDVGEAKPRTVVSGLVKHVPINEMENRMVVLLCNLKPAKMRGVTSEAMVMCASTPDKVEILVPPEGAVPGDLVHIDGYPRLPDAVLNPKKKIFETVAPDLKTDGQRIATFKGAPFTVPGKGTVFSPSLVNVNIK